MFAPPGPGDGTGRSRSASAPGGGGAEHGSAAAGLFGNVIERTVEQRQRRMGRGVGHHLQQPGAIRTQCPLQTAKQRRLVLDPFRLASAGPRDPGMVDGREVAGGGVGAELDRLGIPLETQDSVVEQDDRQRDSAARQRFQFGPAVGEPAAAGPQPWAGVASMRLYGGLLDTPDLMAIEIGGTSCDITVVHGGAVSEADLIRVDETLIALPAIDIHTISAGGCTICGADPGGLLFAGPHGAGPGLLRAGRIRGYRPVFLELTGHFHTVAVLSGADLLPGHVVEGPAIVEERPPPSWSVPPTCWP